MNAREAYLGLNMIQNLGPVRVRALIEALGSPEAVFEADAAALCRVKGIGERLAETIVQGRRHVDPQAELERAAKMGASILTALDPAYPEALAQIYDPPLVLYVRGRLEAADRHAFALIGSRRATHYGLQTADRFAYQLAQLGYTVVSGLARGIDTAAHRGALKARGRTIAVLGGALDKLYPEENRDLAEAIAESGALISEFPFGREPDRTTFPYRNRVVSGLSLGVVVVESPLNSGSLITADMAAEQGRQVFAVPGRIDSPASQGCHVLIKQGAKLAAQVDDILEEYDSLFSREQMDRLEDYRKMPDIPLSEDEARVVRALGEGPEDIDTLARKAGLTASAIGGLLLGLEMKRIVRALPGRRLELNVRLEDIRR